MKKQKLKKPTDYQIFSFRVDSDFKIEFTDKVERIVEVLNSNIGDEYKKIKKKDIIREALSIGLEKMNKEKCRK